MLNISTDPKHRYTLEEYFALERESDAKYEYSNGEVFEISGGTLAHDLIVGNSFHLYREVEFSRNPA